MCLIRPQLINVNSNEPLFFLYSVEINKCSGCCVPDVVKDISFKEFNLMSSTNETKYIK